MTPLVMLHGGATDHRCWAHVRPHLEDRFALVTPDLPGHGAAPPPAEDSAEAVAAGLDLDLPARWFLVGHSFGGMVAMALAARARPAPAAVVLADTFCRPAAGADAWTRITAMIHGARAIGHDRIQSRMVDHWDIGTDGPDADLRASMLHRPAWPIWRMLRAVRRFDGRPHLKALGMPVLALSAGGNPDTDGHAEKIARHAPEGRVEVMPRVGHLMMRDDPAAFAARVSAFLDGV